jgi:hypothetical protein
MSSAFITINGHVLKEIISNEVKNILGAKPNSFLIEGTDGKVYFAHLGDIKVNEDKLYGNHDGPTLFLKEGEEVKFDVPVNETHPHVIHVKVLKSSD